MFSQGFLQLRGFFFDLGRSTFVLTSVRLLLLSPGSYCCHLDFGFSCFRSDHAYIALVSTLVVYLLTSTDNCSTVCESIDSQPFCHWDALKQSLRQSRFVNGGNASDEDADGLAPSLQPPPSCNLAVTQINVTRHIASFDCSWTLSDSPLSTSMTTDLTLPIRGFAGVTIQRLGGWRSDGPCLIAMVLLFIQLPRRRLISRTSIAPRSVGKIRVCRPLCTYWKTFTEYRIEWRVIQCRTGPTIFYPHTWIWPINDTIQTLNVFCGKCVGTCVRNVTMLGCLWFFRLL